MTPTLEQQLSRLGERVRSLRKQRAMTQAALADRAGLSARTLRSLEHGEDVQLSTLLRVLRALGTGDAIDRLVPPPTPSPIAMADALKRVGGKNTGEFDV